MFAHAMGHDVFRRKEGRVQEGGKKPLKKSGGHMSPLVAQGLLLQDCTLNIDAEDENKVSGVLNTR